ncbi:MAG: LPXTG cell wall anchor domain-containing protein [Nitrosopumilus sp. H13]|nr:MAG: LPXTG cell wall anchor domain-containing protein [Nitrosopumilus sp. H13]
MGILIIPVLVVGVGGLFYMKRRRKKAQSF